MRRLLVTLLALSACNREPEPPPPPVVAPRAPIVNRPLAAPLERIAFVREDGLWTVSADGSDLTRIVPPTCPRAAEPAWAPDRRWIAFSAALDPDSNLYPRNVFVARPDGAELRQITPFPTRNGDGKSRVRGRAVLVIDGERRPLPGLRVVAGGQQRVEATDGEGLFQIWAPTGVGWVKLSGSVDGRAVVASRFIAGAEGYTSDLKDVPVSFGAEDLPSAPAWSGDGQLIYVLGHASGAAIRRVKVDGVGDETLASFPTTSIIAGPVVRGGLAWVKMSDGAILQIDLKSKAVSPYASAGLSAPDALAVSPKGDALATLAMDAAGVRSIVLVKKDGIETAATFKPDEPAPHAVDFSPEGGRLVYDRRAADGKSSVWILTLATKQTVRLAEAGSSPVWNGR